MARQIKITDERELFNYACRYLERYPSSVLKLKTKLKQKCDDISIIDSVLQRLQSLNYLNDLELAESLIRALIRRGYGRNRIIMKLKEKKLNASSITEKFLSSKDARDKERSALISLIEKKTERLNLKAASGKKKIVDFLIRRGFDPATVYEVLREKGII